MARIWRPWRRITNELIISICVNMHCAEKWKNTCSIIFDADRRLLGTSRDTRMYKYHSLSLYKTEHFPERLLRLRQKCSAKMRTKIEKLFNQVFSNRYEPGTKFWSSQSFTIARNASELNIQHLLQSMMGNIKIVNACT